MKPETKRLRELQPICIGYQKYSAWCYQVAALFRKTGQAKSYELAIEEASRASKIARILLFAMINGQTFSDVKNEIFELI